VLLADALGSTLALTDPTGATKTQYTYEPFGMVTASGESSANPTAFTGREADGTGLYSYRARYYDPATQRFASEDPLRFAGGDANLYAYVRNSPSNLTDPIGQCPWCIGAVIGAGSDLVSQLAEHGGNWRCISVGRLLLNTGLGALGGGVGGKALTGFLGGLSNGTKGAIGEGLSYVENRLAGSSLRYTQGPIQGFTTKVDSAWYSWSGTAYYVESKFGTSGLTRAQRVAADALGDAYRVERWTYDFFERIGGYGGGTMGAVAGNQMFGRNCPCR
jgi:RHS repeat-associated protein